MRQINTEHDYDYYSRYNQRNRTKKKFHVHEKERYISRIPLKNGNNLLLTPKPTFANFRTPEEYMMKIYEEGVETIVVFLESQEEEGLLRLYKDSGFNVIHFPIRDFNIPSDMAALSRVIHDIRKALAKHSVAMHCFGGNGRTGLVATSILVQMGMGAQDAINKIRKYRPEAIETAAQEKFIHDFEFFERFIN